MKFLRDITEFIFLEDLPEKADLIIVPGNTWPQPARRAAALYHEGMAPYIVVSGRYSKGQQTFAGAACEGDRYKGVYMTEADFLTDVLIREECRRRRFCRNGKRNLPLRMQDISEDCWKRRR
ncbi:MAG: hypothetical protein ACLR1V_12135 [Coprococcus sp.]